jgi:hypothetical protein
MKTVKNGSVAHSALPRARWTRGKILPQKWVENASADVAKAFAVAILAAPKQTAHTTEKALLSVHSPCHRWSQRTRVAVSELLLRRADVVAIVARERDSEFTLKLMGKQERRAALAAIVRTPVTEVADASGDLRDSLTPDQQRAIKRVKVHEDKDGAVTREVEMLDPIAAARLDAELAGDLVRGGAVAVQVNVGDQRQDRPAKDLLAELRAKGVDTKAVVDAYLASIESAEPRGAGKSE